MGLRTEREEIKHFNTLVEIFQLPMIGDAIRASPDRSMWETHLKKLIAGTHPHTDSKDNPAWNFQYEVYLAAATQLAGYTMTLDEPDIVLKEGNHTVGIAAKRPHSLAN